MATHILVQLLGLPWLTSWVTGSTWTFGQMLAVTIWAPIIIEFLYSAIFGVEKAQEHRLIAPFKVVKQPSIALSDETTQNPAQQNASYRGLDSRSDMELPLVQTPDGVAIHSSSQIDDRSLSSFPWVQEKSQQDSDIVVWLSQDADAVYVCRGNLLKGKGRLACLPGSDEAIDLLRRNASQTV
ncbi:hypothetical protein B0A50_03221 [Salinomyces thailandicus]|uniref:Uncharacterized protein n=1 Tax=Salinomyces thailandicus TaxID=706561 RepID=A0A4U0U4R0_9PEZI|nr:hypothetical protein B0A50_03221 [Salinomyces thailandica]